MKVAIVDYGMGNIGSLRRALAELGANPFIADRPEQLQLAERCVLPGVGSFADATALLNRGGWIDAVREQVNRGKPLLGICLGMQLLASRGTEFGNHDGLDLIQGEVRRIDELGSAERLPHVGWNNIRLTDRAEQLFNGISTGTDFYFVHSFAMDLTDRRDALADVDYGVPLLAAVARGNVFGTQFHPEKSSKAGFRLLKNFLDYVPC